MGNGTADNSNQWTVGTLGTVGNQAKKIISEVAVSFGTVTNYSAQFCGRIKWVADTLPNSSVSETSAKRTKYIYIDVYSVQNISIDTSIKIYFVRFAEVSETDEFGKVSATP